SAYQHTRDQYPPDQLAQHLKDGEIITGDNKGKDPALQADQIKYTDTTDFILAQDRQSDHSIIERTFGSFNEAYTKGKILAWLDQFEIEFIHEVAVADSPGSMFIYNEVREACAAAIRAQHVDNPGLALFEDGLVNIKAPQENGGNQLEMIATTLAAQQ